MSIVGNNLADRGAALDSSPLPPRPGELSIFGSIRHYRKLVIAIILASILAAGAYIVTRPAEYTATAIVVVKDPGNIPLLNPQTTVSADRYVTDQAVILSSFSVAQKASRLGASQRPAVILSADYFQHHTTVTTSEATSNQIAIAFSAPTQDEAVGGSDAVVRAYLQVVSDRLAGPLDAATSDIDSKIADTDRQLALKSSTGPPASELLSRRAVLVGRRDELTTQAAARGNGVELYVAAASASESARRSALPVAVVVILAGALLSVATAFVLGAVRRPLARAHDGAAILGAPLVAVVPAFRSASASSGLVGPGRKRRRSNATAAFRRTAASLTIRTPGSPSIAVVSARAGDGRSTLTANLGLALAESGVKTLLIDGCSDGNLSHMLLGDQDDGPGWTDVVDGHADLGTAITTVKVQDSLLWVMRPGRRSGVTSAMLPWSEGGTRLTALVRALELDYYVLIDTPALLPGADGSALTAAAGSILVVVRDNSLAGDLEQVRARLALTGIPASWCVVNHRPPRWSPLARRMRRVPLPEIIAARSEPANTAPKSDPEPPWVGVRGRRSRT